jgi:hypothetical protein
MRQAPPSTLQIGCLDILPGIELLKAVSGQVLVLQDRAPSHDNSSSETTPAPALLEHTLSIDPQSVEARSSSALALVNRALNRMTYSRTADIARAKDLVTQSLTISPRSTLAHYVNAHILRAEGRCGDAIPEYEMVIASNRNFAGALADRRSGTCVNSERIPVDPPR